MNLSEKTYWPNNDGINDPTEFIKGGFGGG